MEKSARREFRLIRGAACTPLACSRHGCGHLCCPPLLLSALISAHLLRHSHDRTSPSLHRLALFSSPLLLFSSRGLLLSAAFLAASLRLAVPLIGGCRIRGRHASLAAAPLVHCAPLFTAAPLYLHCRASVCCTCCRMCDVSDDAKNDVPCVVCIVSHVREERFVLNDSSQNGSLFRFWFGPCRKRNDSYPIGARWRTALSMSHMRFRLCAALDTGVHRVTGKRRSPRRGTAVGPPGRGTMMMIFRMV